ncbi:MAG: tRNA pseudouridine(55) synthase TruB [Pyrinomonadaceae bacterium]|nr:tRNA pseudouridine(55) synthase TruB [Pyrinomonadaceae bacterium]
MTDGILIIDKPTDWTSHDVVGKLRRILKTKRIGHTGTLDPFATGVLVMLVGQATRLAQFLDKDVKEYEAVVRLGFETDTGDLTGSPKSQVSSLKSITPESLKDALAAFRGEILQTPPMYSAKKVDGKKLYELARKGVEIERKPVAVTIYELEIKDQRPKTKDQIEIRVLCTAGTYIRTLAQDIGRKIGTGAHLTALRRTRAGKFDLAKALTIKQLEEVVSSGKLNDYLISMNEAASHLPEISLNEEEVKKIRNGMKLPSNLNAESVRLTDSENNLIAIGTAHENFVRPKIVFV